MKSVNKTKAWLTKLLCLICLVHLFLMASKASAQTCIAQLYSDSLFTTLLDSWQNAPCNGAPLCHNTSRPVQLAIDASTTNNAIKVSGLCERSVNITEAATRLLLDGQGTASIVATTTDTSTISINGSAGITIRNFLSIRGGSSGILVNRGASAVIVNNTIEDNTAGIVVADGATARIGTTSGNDIVASPNIIRNNTLNGISVNRNSSARIVGNTISGNEGGAGVSVTKVSQADLASNNIDGNGTNGIEVSGNSGVNLGNNSGTTIFDLPNSTTVNNLGVGVSCSMKSYVAGRVGTINGNNGRLQMEGKCVSSASLDDSEFLGGTTSGTITSTGGWTLTVRELPERLSPPAPIRIEISVSGTGTAPATFDMCPAGGAQRVLLDSAGEAAEVDCVTTTTGTNASTHVSNPSSSTIEVRDPATGEGVLTLLPPGQGVTVGSPVIPDSSNTQVIGVAVVTANDVPIAAFGLQHDQSVDVQQVSSGPSAVSVLSAGSTGSITMQLAGQEAILTLNGNDAVTVQSDPTSGTSSVGVVTGSVELTIGGQTTTIDAGEALNGKIVSIDIQPGTFPNLINQTSKGGTPVAILTTSSFDATLVDLDFINSVTLAGAPVLRNSKGQPMYSLKDVNGDGFSDLVLHVDTFSLSLPRSPTPFSANLVLVGRIHGQEISGTDRVVVVKLK